MAIEVSSEESLIPKPLLELAASYGQHGGKYGVLLEAKSNGWEDLFEKISGGKTMHWKKNGVETDLYEIPINDGDRGFNDLFPYGGKQLILNEPGGIQTLSLYYLRMPGLGKGVEVFYPGIFENDTIRKYVLRAGDKSMELYKKLAPGSIKMKVWVDDWKDLGR